MKENDILKCPVCDLSLHKSDASFVCLENHTFDISKDGYVNLLLPNQKNSKNPGDNKKMLLHRRDFLNKGYYYELLQTVFQTIQEFFNEKKIHNLNILDIGCGEGYYSCILNDLIKKSDLNTSFWGIDLSKDAVYFASKRSKEVNFIVGNTYFLPFLDKKFDIVFSIFSPLGVSEINRITKDDSLLIIVGPGKRHLFELIELIYDKPKTHEQNKQIEIPGEFKQLFEKELNYFLDLTNREDIGNLFSMTPYFWQAPLEKQDKILALEQLKVEINFTIKVFQKNNSPEGPL